MEASALIKIVPPIILALMMIGMGMSLVPDDFKRVWQQPRAVVTGLIGQIIFLPLIAFILLLLWPIDPVLSIGFMVLASCPGGPGSNLLVLLCRGDVALSVTLTAVSSLIAALSLPLFTHFSIALFLDQERYLDVWKVLDMGLKVCAITLIPVMIGMMIRHKHYALATRYEKKVRVASVLFLLILILAIALKERANLLSLLEQAGVTGVLLCLVTMATGYLLARLLKLSVPQRRAVMVEVGIQNAALALLVTTVMLDNTAMAIPAAVYSPVMLTMSGLLVLYFHIRSKNVSA